MAKSKQTSAKSVEQTATEEPAKGAAGGQPPAGVTFDIDESTGKPGKKPSKRQEFSIGVVSWLSRQKPAEYLDTGCEHGLGLRVGKSHKATWFLRFMHAGKNYNRSLGAVPGSPSAGKALEPMNFKDVREAARKYRLDIVHPIDKGAWLGLRETFYYYVENKTITRDNEILPLSDSSKREYLELFERHCAHLGARDIRSLDWSVWKAVRAEALTGKRGKVQLMHKPHPKRKVKALKGSLSAANKIMAMISGMYKLAKITDNPILVLRTEGSVGTPPPRKTYVTVPELPALFAALRGLRSPIAYEFYLITLLTGWRREAILQMQRGALDCNAGTYTSRRTMVGWKRAPPGEYPIGRWLVEHVVHPLYMRYTTGPFLFPIRKSMKAAPSESESVSEHGGLMPARPNSPNLVGVINSVQRDFGRRITPTDVRRSFASIAKMFGIDSDSISALTGHSVLLPSDKPKTPGVRTMDRHYIQIPPEVLRRDIEDIVSAILECAGELPLSPLVRAKLSRIYPAHLAALEGLAVNAKSERRALAAPTAAPPRVSAHEAA